MRYTAQPGDSPTTIARTYGVPFDALIRANSRKLTTIVAGQRTWVSLVPGEEIIVPVGGMVGSPATDAVNALLSAGGPCLQANVGLVCAAQRMLGVTADGKWGNDSANAAKSIFPGAPPACSPRPSWWAPKGQSNCTSAPSPTASSGGSSLDAAASNALAALLADSNYCTNVKRVGSSVNNAIHAFKKAWNAANPSNPVPVGTGNYEPIVQIALALALNTQQSNVPTGCGATPASPPPPPPPSPSSPSFIDPCNPANVSAVCEMQRAAGLTVDGKYGANSAAAARRSDPNAPGPCIPSPSWWKPKGQSNCPGAAPPPGIPTPITPPPSPSPAVVPVTVPAPVAALTTINPCLESSLDVVYAAQRALGVSPDGKYGDDTANAARRLLPNAPLGCSPRPAWWAPKGQSNTPSGPPVPTPPPRPPEPAPSVVVPVPVTPSPSPSPGPGGQPIVVAPVVEEKKKISTGAIVAGAIGALALVGVIAVASTSGKKGSRGARGPRGRRPARRKTASRKKR